jgi:hypothetical protein
MVALYPCIVAGLVVLIAIALLVLFKRITDEDGEEVNVPPGVKRFDSYVTDMIVGVGVSILFDM